MSSRPRTDSSTSAATPDITDLLLACDVFVTDYSSTMFDFTATGKPIVFYVPDLEEYDTSRGVYFDLAAIAPGPLVATADALAGVLRGVDDLRDTYAERYAAWRARFNPLDDGQATARVLERLDTAVEQARAETGSAATDRQVDVLFSADPPS